MLLATGCTASIHRTANHYPLKLRHQRHLPYYHCPICGTIVPKTGEKHICHVLTDVPYFGHQATCWQQWPSDWVGCPEEVIDAPVDMFEADVRGLPLPMAPEYQAIEERIEEQTVDSSRIEPQAQVAPPQTSPIDYPMIRTPPLADEPLSDESFSDRGPSLGDARSARPIFEAPSREEPVSQVVEKIEMPVLEMPVLEMPAPKVVEAPAPKVVQTPKPKIVESQKPKIVEAPKPKVVEAPKVVAKRPVARSVTRTKMPMTSSPSRASQTASLKLVATAPKKMPTALAETAPTETVKKVGTSKVTSAKLRITPASESTVRPSADVRIASRGSSRVSMPRAPRVSTPAASTIPSRSPQIRFRGETGLKLKPSSAPPTDPAKTPTPIRFRLAQR